MTTQKLSRLAAKLPTRRERTRAATVDEIKQTALSIMRENSTTDIRFADIAREMGLTAPALYRYFADRDELLTAMIVDAFVDLGAAISDAVSEAMAEIGDDDLGDRLMAAAQAYRQWAKRDPQRFALIFGIPVPGYHAPEEGPTVDAAKNAMGNLGSIVLEAIRRGVAQPPLVSEVGPAVAACLVSDHLAGAPIPLVNRQSMLHAWSALHGFVCLEAYGQLDHFDEPGRDELFAGQVRLVALGMGMPPPPARQ